MRERAMLHDYAGARASVLGGVKGGLGSQAEECVGGLGGWRVGLAHRQEFAGGLGG